AHLLLDRGELSADVVHIVPARRELGLELRVMRAEAQLDAAVRRKLLHALEQGIGMRFADPVGMKALQMNRCLHAALRKQPGNDVLVQHARQLPGNAGREHESRLADVERETACRADRIVEYLGAGRQHGLLAVAGRHHAAASMEIGFHPGKPLLVQDEIHTRGLGGNLLGKVIDRGSQSAVDDDGVGALPGESKREQQALAIVSHLCFPTEREPELLELLAYVAEVGVDDLAGENLAPRAYDFYPHASACPLATRLEE